MPFSRPLFVRTVSFDPWVWHNLSLVESDNGFFCPPFHRKDTIDSTTAVKIIWRQEEPSLPKACWPRLFFSRMVGLTFADFENIWAGKIDTNCKGLVDTFTIKIWMARPFFHFFPPMTKSFFSFPYKNIFLLLLWSGPQWFEAKRTFP